MEVSMGKILKGYREFRDKYVHGDNSVMRCLSENGQNPEIMIVSCSDSRVDPALILQCDPGDLFVVRNIANIVPPYEADEAHHGTSAALEYGILFLRVKHLIILGHSQCGGIQAILDSKGCNTELKKKRNDFIDNWVSIIGHDCSCCDDVDEYAKAALHQSYKNCLMFPWIKSRVEAKELVIHMWFFDIKTGQIFSYSDSSGEYIPL